MAQHKRTVREAEYRPLIRDLPASERPRERLREYGANSLSNAELLAIILQTGTVSESVLNLATRLLAQFQGLDGLARAGYGELCNVHGVGEAKAAQVQAAMELGKRLSAVHGPEKPAIHSPQDVANLLLSEMSLLDQEHLRVISLDTRNKIIAISEVYKGSVNTTTVRAAEIFRDAVRHNSPAIVIVHNHPSGDPTPSQEDVSITKELAEAGKLLGIEVLDHIVIGRHTFASLKERGLGFS